MVERLRLSEEQWRERLSPVEFRVLREHGTEPAGTGCLLGTKEPGTYTCAACGHPLFRSGEKFHSGTGWPSFTAPLAEDSLTEHEDRAYGMLRTEVRCARCGSHLGHVFPDGPPPTGLRYCINSVAMLFPSLAEVGDGRVPTGLRYCINSVAMRHVPQGQPITLVTE